MAMKHQLAFMSGTPKRKATVDASQRAMTRLATKLGRELRKTQKQLAEAEWLIKELETHEGAEGWSEYLRKRLDAYEYKTKGTAK